MTAAPVLAVRSSPPVVATHPEQGMDVGQRYEIRYIVRDGDTAQTLGWTNDPERADAAVNIWRRHVDTAAAWVYDRGTVGIFKKLQRLVETGRNRDAALDREFYWWFMAQPEGCAGEVDGNRCINFFNPLEGGVEWFGLDRYPLGFWSPTRSIGDARALTRRVFPDWWINSGVSSLSSYAAMGPDYAGPARERLLREFSTQRFDDRFHCNLGPGGDESCECRALLSCLLQARVAMLQERRGHFSPSIGGRENG